MQHEIDAHAPATDGPGTRQTPATIPMLDYERLDVYRVALEFRALASSITLPAGHRELRDRLDRASLSIVLNTAEGGGRVGAADKSRFYAMARGSAMECAAILDVLRLGQLVPGPVCNNGRSLLVRIVQMPTRLCLRLKA
jgi:four helix bundle protein